MVKYLKYIKLLLVIAALAFINACSQTNVPHERSAVNQSSDTRQNVAEAKVLTEVATGEKISSSKLKADTKEFSGSASSAEALRKKQLAQQYNDELDRALNGPDDPEQANFGSPTKLRESYDACINSSRGATPDIIDCGVEEYKYQDARLNRAYRVLMSRIGVKQGEVLREEQRNWIKKRDVFCDLNGDLGGGQAEVIEESSCRLNATAKRADELERRQDLK